MTASRPRRRRSPRRFSPVSARCANSCRWRAARTTACIASRRSTAGAAQGVLPPPGRPARPARGRVRVRALRVDRRHTVRPATAGVRPGRGAGAVRVRRRPVRLAEAIRIAGRAGGRVRPRAERGAVAARRGEPAARVGSLFQSRGASGNRRRPRQSTRGRRAGYGHRPRGLPLRSPRPAAGVGSRPQRCAGRGAPQRFVIRPAARPTRPVRVAVRFRVSQCTARARRPA